MHRIVRTLVVLTLALGLVLPGCGSGSGGSGDFFGLKAGPASFGVPLPVFGGSINNLSLCNTSAQSAVVFLQAFSGTGAPSAPTTLTLAPRETRRVGLASIGAASTGGYLLVDTRNRTVLDASGFPTPRPTTGFVFPSIERRIGGVSPAADVYEGFAWRTSVNTEITSDTTSLQFFNGSVSTPGAAPVAMAYRLREYDLDGTMVADITAAPPIGPNATLSYTPTVTFGFVQFDPMPLPGQLARIGARTVENGFYTSIQDRFKVASDAKTPPQKELGFEVTFGEDAAGNRYDFATVLCNPTNSAQTVTLRAIYRESGAAPMLSTPRFFSVSARSTVYMATTNALSAGLGLGETSFYNDLFGDVLSATSFERVTLLVQTPREVNVSTRRFDPAFNSFYLVQNGIIRTTSAVAIDMPLEPILGTGRFNEVIMTNPEPSPIQVAIRGVTLGGTEYILDTVTVPARSRYTWSPDGLQLREDPNDTIGPLVKALCIRFTPLQGLLFRARTREFNNTDSIVLLSPLLIRAQE